MADYYIAFSIALPLPRVGIRLKGASDAVAEWVDNFNEQGTLMMEDPSSDPENLYLERYAGIDIEMEYGAALVVSDGDTGNVNAAEQAIASYLKHFNMEGAVFFSWAEYCSELHNLQFGGGSSLIDRTGVLKSLSTADLRMVNIGGVDNIIN